MPLTDVRWPEAGATITVHLPCCEEDRPLRVVEVLSDGVVVAASPHRCGATGAGLAVVWFTAGRRWRTTASYVESGSWPHLRWRLLVDQPPAAVERAHERVPEQRVIQLWRGGAMIAARMVDRSSGGLGCTAPQTAPLAPGDVVDVELGDGTPRITGARVVRARPSGRSLDVGLAF